MDIEDLSGYCPNSSANCFQNKDCKRISEATNQGKIWYRVNTIQDLLDILQRAPDYLYMLVAGNTAQGIKPISTDITTFIDISLIEEMHAVQHNAECLTLGALVSISEAIKAMAIAAKVEGFEYLQRIAEHFKMIATIPIRNVRTLRTRW